MIYISLFLVFFVTGLFTIGGGYAMIPMITEQLTNLSWASFQEITDFIAVSESTPGPFAVNIATMIGFRQGGVFGSIVAVLGVVLPSFIIILLIATLFRNKSRSRLGDNALKGILPAVSGLIISAGILTFIKAGTASDLKGLLIFALMACLSLWKRSSPIIIVGLSAVLGIVLF